MDSPAAKRRAVTELSKTDFVEPLSVTFLSLSDDILLSIVASLNDLDGLRGLFLSFKRMATLLAAGDDRDCWRQLMMRRSWHPRWAFKYYQTSESSLSAPDKWRREYLYWMQRCTTVWKGFRIIKNWYRDNDEVIYNELFRGVSPTPESHLVELEQRIHHPIPNDLKEFMRLHSGFHHTLQTFDALFLTVERMNFDCEPKCSDWRAIFTLKPVADWQSFYHSPLEYGTAYSDSMLYNEDEISEELPRCFRGDRLEIEVPADSLDSSDSSYRSVSSEESEEIDDITDEPRPSVEIAHNENYFWGLKKYSNERTERGLYLDLNSSVLKCDEEFCISSIAKDVCSIADIMRLAIECLSTPDEFRFFVDSDDDDDSEQEEGNNLCSVESLSSDSLDEDEMQLCSVATECFDDIGASHFIVTKAAYKRLVNYAQDFVADAFKATGTLTAEPGMLKAQADEMLKRTMTRSIFD